MKRFTKICLMLSLIFFSIGIVLCIAGFCSGYSVSAFVEDVKAGRFSVGAEKVVEVFQECVDPENFEGDEGTQSFTGVKELEVEADAASLRVLAYDGGEIQVEAVKPTENYQCRQKKDKLVIEDKDHSGSYFLSHPTPEITVYLPRGLTLTSLTVESGMGDMELTGVRCEKLSIENGMGNLEFTGEIQKKGEIDCGMGNAELTLAGKKEDYAVEISCGMGSVELDGESYSGLGTDKKINKDAEKKLELENGMGNITVEFGAAL